jgi:hypothetical protein
MQGMRLESVPQGVIRLLSTDTAQSLDLVDDFPDDVNELLIVCEEHPVRIGLGGTVPTQAVVADPEADPEPIVGVDALGLKLDPGATLWLGSRAAVRSFQYLSAASGDAGVLQVIKLVRSY